MRKVKWLALLPLLCVGLLGLVGWSGCGAAQDGASTPQVVTITGTVQDIYSAMNYNAMTKTWSAELMVTPDYNGAPNVNIGNDGNDQSLFDDFIKNGDTLTIQVNGSLNSIEASWVTVNGTPLDSYSPRLLAVRS